MSSELRTATAATHQETVTFNDLARMADLLRNLPPEPIGEWMRKHGYPPEEWTLVLPEQARPCGVSQMLTPSYVRFSAVVDQPVFIRPPGINP